MKLTKKEIRESIRETIQEQAWWGKKKEPAAPRAAASPQAPSGPLSFGELAEMERHLGVEAGQRLVNELGQKIMAKRIIVNWDYSISYDSGTILNRETGRPIGANPSYYLSWSSKVTIINGLGHFKEEGPSLRRKRIPQTSGNWKPRLGPNNVKVNGKRLWKKIQEIVGRWASRQVAKTGSEKGASWTVSDPEFFAKTLLGRMGLNGVDGIIGDAVVEVEGTLRPEKGQESGWLKGAKSAEEVSAELAARLQKNPEFLFSYGHVRPDDTIPGYSSTLRESANLRDMILQELLKRKRK